MPSKNIANNPVLVTGASGALGSAMIDVILERGAPVVAVGHDREALASLPEGAHREVADLQDPSEVDALFTRVMDRYGPVGTVVHTVGGFRGGTTAETPVDDYRLMVNLNLDTAWFISQAAAKQMKAAGHGAIIFVAARNGLEVVSDASAYSVSKAAVVHLTKVLSSELRLHGVRVNAVAPSLIDTPANRAVLPEAIMARAVSPEAIAKVIAFLISDDGAPVVGAVVPVYGAGSRG